MKKICLVACLLTVSGWCRAGQTVFNPFTGTLDFVSTSSLAGAGLLASTQTWSGFNTFSTLSLSSLTVTGSGAGQVLMTEGASSSVTPATGVDVMWADSTAHSFRFNPNGGVSTYTVVGSSTTPTVGHVAAWSGSGSLIDGGTGGGGSFDATQNITFTGYDVFSKPIAVSTDTPTGVAAGNVNTIINGGNTTMSGTRNFFLGPGNGVANINGASNVCIGATACNKLNQDNTEVCIGDSACASLQDQGNANNVGIGQLALFNSSDTINTTAIGRAALYENVHGTGNTAVGSSACQNTSSEGSLNDIICLGATSRLNTSNTMAVGSVAHPINDVYWNSINPGLTNTGVSIVHHAQDASGADHAGGSFTIAGGGGTGTGLGGSIIFKVAPPGGSGSSVNALSTVLTLSTATASSTNHAMCWKANAVPGYCSTVVAADGTCTCN